VGPASRPRSSPTRSPPSAHPRGLGPRARPGPAPLWPPGRPEARDTDARIPYRFTTPVLILICLTRGSAMVPGARRRRGESRGTVRGGGRQRRLSARSCRPRACAASRPRPSPGTRAGRVGSPAGAAGCLLLSRRPGFFHTHTRNLPFSCLHDTLGLDTSYTFLPSHGLGLLRNFSLYPSDWFCHLGQLGRLKQGGERPWL
jgi:hypothetical protein